MFADETLLGQCDAKTDNKGRIIIPKWTKREAGEVLICLKDKSLNLYRIYNENSIDYIIEEIKKFKEKCKNIEDLEQIKKIELEFYKSIIIKAKVDKQGRFLIGEELQEKTLKLIGAGNNLILELK